MATVLMILLMIMYAIPQKSYACDSYITDKNPYMLVGGCIPILPLDPPLLQIAQINFARIRASVDQVAAKKTVSHRQNGF